MEKEELADGGADEDDDEDEEEEGDQEADGEDSGEKVSLALAKGEPSSLDKEFSRHQGGPEFE